MMKKDERHKRRKPCRDSYVRQGDLEVRLATSFDEIKQAQRLRYKVFYKEMQAQADLATRILKRDIDPFDSICDHLVVLDHDRPAHKQVVGTYRLLPQEVAEHNTGFYSEREFDLTDLKAFLANTPDLEGKQLLEVGRSCVHHKYRSGKVIDMLWQGIAGYIADNDISHLFGCASFEGTDISAIAEPLSYLYHYHMEADWPLVSAQADRYVHMNRIKKDAIDVKRARRALPPLIKGYLRLGCTLGYGAVTDSAFGTTDIFILQDVASITRRYGKKYDIRSGTPIQSSGRIDQNRDQPTVHA